MDIVFIEIPEFVQKIDRIASHDEFLQLQNELLLNPTKGKIERGTGGARKIRMGLRGRGKSGGARVVYYFVDLRGEIWFLDVYLKKDKASLKGHDKNRIYRFIKEELHAEE